KRIAQAQRDESAEPQAKMRSCPRPDGREQPANHHEQMREPARHLAAASDRDEGKHRKEEDEAPTGSDREVDVKAREPNYQRDDHGANDNRKCERANPDLITLTRTRGAPRRDKRPHPGE